MENKPQCSQSIACVLVLDENHGSISRARQAEAFAEACLRFSPQVALRKGEAVFIEIGKSIHLISEKTFPLKLQALANRMGLKNVRVAIAPNASTALAQARHRKNEPLEALYDYFNPFERDLEGEKRVRLIIEKVQLLGIRTLPEFLQLPSDSLASRLGREAVLLQQRIRGIAPIVWPGFHPVPIISEKTTLEDVTTQTGSGDLEALLFVLKGVVDRAFARLHGRGERASKIQITLDLDSWSTIQIPRRQWLIDLPMPQGSVVGLIPILRDRLNFDFQKEPLQTPAISLQFEVLESVPGKAAQRDFFTKEEEDAEAWNALVARLCQKLSIENVFVAVPIQRYLPEQSYSRVLDPKISIQSEKITHLIPPRPARVLKKPESVHLQDQTLIHFQSGKSWKTLQWDGPERLSGDWWKQGFRRDYFRIHTEGGEQLWVFSQEEMRRTQGNTALAQSAPSLFLHGFFD